MSISILVLAAERFEAFVELAVVQLDSVNLNTGLSVEQMTKLLELLQPELVKHRLADFDNLRLVYLIDGAPKLEHLWAFFGEGDDAPDAEVPLGPGRRLGRFGEVRPDLPVFEL